MFSCAFTRPITMYCYDRNDFSLSYNNSLRDLVKICELGYEFSTDFIDNKKIKKNAYILRTTFSTNVTNWK